MERACANGCFGVQVPIRLRPFLDILVAGSGGNDFPKSASVNLNRTHESSGKDSDTAVHKGVERWEDLKEK